MPDLFSFGTDLERTGAVHGIVEPRECRVALSPSRLPGLDLALNPYTGCSHGCIYCYAPYVLRTPPSEWGRKVIAKTNISKLLEKELKEKHGVIGLGTVTDPYQAAEKEWGLSRKCLIAIKNACAQVSVLTKSGLITRDLDVLKDIDRCEVGITITTDDDRIAQMVEPGAPPPSSRFKALEELNRSGIDTYVMIGPIIPEIIEARISSFLGKISTTGTKRVMMDPLNLRPGMNQAIYDAMHKHDERLANAIFQCASDRYVGCEEKIVSSCKAVGLDCIDAF